QIVAADDTSDDRDGCFLRREVDADRLDARHLGDRPLDPSNAARAGHPFDRENDLFPGDAVARGLDCLPYSLERGQLWVQPDRRPLVGQIDAHALYSGDLCYRSFDPADTAGAGHSLDGNADLPALGWRLRIKVNRHHACSLSRQVEQFLELLDNLGL